MATACKRLGSKEACYSIFFFFLLLQLGPVTGQQRSDRNCSNHSELKSQFQEECNTPCCDTPLCICANKYLMHTPPTTEYASPSRFCKWVDCLVHFVHPCSSTIKKVPFVGGLYHTIKFEDKDWNYGHSVLDICTQGFCPADIYKRYLACSTKLSCRDEPETHCTLGCFEDIALCAYRSGCLAQRSPADLLRAELKICEPLVKDRKSTTEPIRAYIDSFADPHESESFDAAWIAAGVVLVCFAVALLVVATCLMRKRRIEGQKRSQLQRLESVDSSEVKRSNSNRKPEAP